MREFCRMLVGGGKKWFDFALLAAGYDAGGKNPRAVLCVRSLGRLLGRRRGSWAYSAISERSGWGAAAGRGRFPQLGIVGELLEGLVVAGRLEPRQRRAQKRMQC